MKKKFYITTPIYYPSGDLHIGHAYTTVLADAIKRYKDNQGFDTYFLTGSDEHGQKIQQKAKEQDLTPIKFLDMQVEKFIELWKLLGISYDQFIRTTDPNHKASVQKIFSQLLSDKKIYKDYYDGLYCVPCESNWQLSQVEKINEKYLCGDCKRPLDSIKEESYFYKLSGREEFIKKIFKNDFLIPQRNVLELLSKFVDPGLKDLSVSRTTFDWGVFVKEDPKHIIYVWIDALPNYITALGWGHNNDDLFKKFWNNDTEILHLVGKEIIRFHAIYWPIMLNDLGILPKNIKVMGHGWITSEGQKMSKSLGNVIDPIKLINQYGDEHLRYYLAKEISTTNDGDFAHERFINIYNSDLANKYGNLISRVHTMIKTYFDGQIPTYSKDATEFCSKMENCIFDDYKKYQKHFDAYQVSKALKTVMALADKTNLYIDDTKPWELAKNKENKEKLGSILNKLVKAIEMLSFMLKPVLIHSAQKAIDQFGIDQPNFNNILNWEKNDNKKIKSKENLFPRLENE